MAVKKINATSDLVNYEAIITPSGRHINLYSAYLDNPNNSNQNIILSLSGTYVECPPNAKANCSAIHEGTNAESLIINAPSGSEIIVTYEEIVDAATILKFHASSKMIGKKASIPSASGWQELGGVVTNPAFFIDDMNSVIGRIVGSYKANGGGAELRIMESNDDYPEAARSLVAASYQLPDTNGKWSHFAFNTDISPSGQSLTYSLEGQLNAATSAELRFVSLSLLELILV